METFRVRNTAEGQRRKLLLPISFGPSSTVLLHVLDFHLRNQEKRTGRRGFYLHVLHVEDPTISLDYSPSERLKQLEERFSGHEYSRICLSSLFDHEDISKIAENMPFQPAAHADALQNTSEQRLQAFLGSLPSSTARIDVLQTLRTRLIVDTSKQIGCEGILWGDSTTKLAEKTLAETAKGRGFSLAHQVADGESPLGVPFHYPLNELLKKELVAFTKMTEPLLEPLIAQECPTKKTTSITKNTTIDELMNQYFESVEENFPSIVANVVRTTDRLRAAPSTGSQATCNLCLMPVPGSRFGINGWGGDQEDVGSSHNGARMSLCYGCTRSLPHSNVAPFSKP